MKIQVEIKLKVEKQDAKEMNKSSEPLDRSASLLFFSEIDLKPAAIEKSTFMESPPKPLG